MKTFVIFYSLPISRISKEVLQRLVPAENTGREKPGGFIEQIRFSHVSGVMNDNRVLILAGIRRCGKSTLLKQPMQDAVIFFSG
jgi:hypothetical protein